MTRPPTMKDVAKKAGVSVMTVSRAFKRDASVGQETRARILAVAEELGYVFDSRAANLRTQRSRFVAVTIPSLNNANFAETVEGITNGLSGTDLQVLLGYTNYDINREEQLIEELLRRRPEAIVVTGGRHTDRARKLLQSARIPVIETWDVPKTPIDRVVGFSNADTMALVVDHLAEQGATRIAFIGGDAEGDTRGTERRRGFLSAMEARALGTDRLVATGRPPVSMQSGANAMSRLLDNFSDTEAAICVSDLSAFGALAECQRRGITVPKDIAIAGFGAYDIAGICHPTLTTIDPFPREIGRRSAAIVRSVLDGKDSDGSPSHNLVQPELTLGASTQRNPGNAR